MNNAGYEATKFRFILASKIFQRRKIQLFNNNNKNIHIIITKCKKKTINRIVHTIFGFIVIQIVFFLSLDIATTLN